MIGKNKTIMDYVTNIKLMAGTVVTIAGLVAGSYTLASKFFVTTVQADVLVKQFDTYIKRNDKSVETLIRTQKQLKIMIIENKLIMFENKTRTGVPLTPTEEVQYERLKAQYRSIK